MRALAFTVKDREVIILTNDLAADHNKLTDIRGAKLRGEKFRMKEKRKNTRLIR